jgi:hypothetical protein
MLIKSLRQLAETTYNSFFQAILFDDADRREFLEIMHAQLSGNLPLSQVLQNITHTGTSQQMKTLAQQSLQDLTLYQDSSRRWRRYFPLKDAMQLRAAAQQDQLMRGIDLVLAGKEEAVSFYDTVIKSNAQYILFVGGFLLMIVLLAGQRSLLQSFNQDMLLLKYMDALRRWAPVFLVFGTTLIAIYYYLRGRLTGSARQIAYKLGLYLIYDRLVAFEFCTLAADSLRNGLDMSLITRIASGIYISKHQAYNLFLIRQRLTDGFPVAQALRNTLLEPRYSDSLASFAPNEGIESLVFAFNKVAKMLNISIAQQLRQIRYYLMIALLLLGSILFYPILQLMTGAAMPTSM